jgi:hypothetical protein
MGRTGFRRAGLSPPLSLLGAEHANGANRERSERLISKQMTNLISVGDPILERFHVWPFVNSDRGRNLTHQLSQA